MKIIFVAAGLQYNESRPFERLGSESVMLGIAKMMVKKGHDVQITGRFQNMKSEEERLIDGVRLLNIEASNLRDNFADEIGSSILYSRQVAKFIKRMNPDIISLNERFSSIFPASIKIPKTYTMHSPDALEFYRKFAYENNKMNYFFFDIKRMLEKRVLIRTNTIIALNRKIANHLLEIGYDSVKIIPNAIDPDLYVNKGNDEFILYAGRFNKVKGIMTLIDAFSKIQNEFRHKLYLIGSGPMEMEIKQHIKRIGITDRVVLLPMMGKDRLREYLSKCSVFVLPSIFECMPVGLLEAMASGKPVIASDIPGPQDVINNNQNGILFRLGDSTELSANLRKCLSSPDMCMRLGIDARKTIELEYSFDRVSNRYLEVFHDIIQ